MNWKDTLDAALAAKPKVANKSALERIAGVVVDKALNGDPWAIEQVAKNLP